MKASSACFLSMQKKNTNKHQAKLNIKAMLPLQYNASRSGYGSFFLILFFWLLLQQGACHAKLRAVAVGNLKILSLVYFSDFFYVFIMALFTSPYQETILTFYFICSRSIDIIWIWWASILGHWLLKNLYQESMRRASAPRVASWTSTTKSSPLVLS